MGNHLPPPSPTFHIHTRRFTQDLANMDHRVYSYVLFSSLMDLSEMDENYAPSSAPSPQGRVNRHNCGKRRYSVSGESIRPADSPLPTPIHKTLIIKKQIEEATRQNLLFKNLDSETREHIVSI